MSSISRVGDVFRGLTDGCAYALTWVTAGALFADTTTDDPVPGSIRIAERLSDVAVDLGLDAVLVPADAPWGVAAARALRDHDIAVLWAIEGVFGRAARRHGWTEAIASSAARPSSLAFTLAEVLHDAAQEVREGLAAEVEAIVVADDLASDAGWLVAPDYALEALVPCYRQLAAAAAPLPVVFHSDGDVRALYGAIAGAGYSAVHIAGGGARMTEAAFRAARAAQLVPMGGIDSTLLATGDPAGAGSFAARMSEGGPAVVCDDGGITTAAQLAAYADAINSARSVCGG